MLNPSYKKIKDQAKDVMALTKKKKERKSREREEILNTTDKLALSTEKSKGKEKLLKEFSE